MKDGAKPHRAVEIFNFLQEHSDDRVIALHLMNHTGKGMEGPPPPPSIGLLKSL